jgi:hypothetical protein
LVVTDQLIPVGSPVSTNVKEYTTWVQVITIGPTVDPAMVTLPEYADAIHPAMGDTL